MVIGVGGDNQIEAYTLLQGLKLAHEQVINTLIILGDYKIVIKILATIVVDFQDNLAIKCCVIYIKFITFIVNIPNISYQIS